MRESLERFWGKMTIGWMIFIIIWTIGILGWVYFCVSFAQTQKEANQVWSDHIGRIENKKDNGVPVEETKKTDAQENSESKAVSQVAPIKSAGEKEISLPALGIEEIVDKVYILESSGGKNDSCKKQRLFNGFGYAQSTFSWKCYKSREEVQRLVEDWFKENLQKYTLAESLCRYNQGTPSDDCEYYQKFKSLGV